VAQGLLTLRSVARLPSVSTRRRRPHVFASTVKENSASVKKLLLVSVPKEKSKNVLSVKPKRRRLPRRRRGRDWQRRRCNATKTDG